MNSSHFNRPMLIEDLAVLDKSRYVKDLRSLIYEYKTSFLPVMNGSFAFSNLLEGKDQVLTSSPYRLWEYTSLMELLEGKNYTTFLDIGGACSPLPFYLSENGYRGLAIDLQPNLVSLCNYISEVRNLPLKARKVDFISDEFHEYNESFDFITCISVIEHVPVNNREIFFEAAYKALKPGGIFYITFDYGHYSAETNYRKHTHEEEADSESIGNIEAIHEIINRTGFHYLFNNPCDLPSDILEVKESPKWRDYTRRSNLNIPAIDSKTPLSTFVKYFVRRFLRYDGKSESRYSKHNFFRICLIKN